MSACDRHPASQPATEPRCRSKDRAYVYVARVKTLRLKKREHFQVNTQLSSATRNLTKYYTVFFGGLFPVLHVSSADIIATLS